MICVYVLFFVPYTRQYTHKTGQHGVYGHRERPFGLAGHTEIGQDEHQNGRPATAQNRIAHTLGHDYPVARARDVSQRSAVERQESRNEQQRPGGHQLYKITSIIYKL